MDVANPLGNILDHKIQLTWSCGWSWRRSRQHFLFGWVPQLPSAGDVGESGVMVGVLVNVGEAVGVVAVGLP